LFFLGNWSKIFSQTILGFVSKSTFEIARTGRHGEARREFETAIRLAAGDSPLFPWVIKEAKSELERLQ
jgi:hypothetical protein